MKKRKNRQNLAPIFVELFCIFLQGLVWFALSVAGIIVKRTQPESLTTSDWSRYTTYTAYLSRIIYNDFMVENSVRLPENRVIRPQDLEAFMWIYAILSAVWVAASLDQNFAIKYQKIRQSYSTLVLGIALLLTSVIDLVFVALLGRDLATCPFDIFAIIQPSTETSTISTTPSIAPISSPQYLKESVTYGTLIDCQVANGIVLSLAARGFVLWLINIILGISLIKIGAQALKTPSLLAYSNNTIPRVRVPDLRKAPSPNHDAAFFEDNNVFPPPPQPLAENRYRNSTPVALNNKNQGIYY